MCVEIRCPKCGHVGNECDFTEVRRSVEPAVEPAVEEYYDRRVADRMAARKRVREGSANG